MEASLYAALFNFLGLMQSLFICLASLGAVSILPLALIVPVRKSR